MDQKCVYLTIKKPVKMFLVICVVIGGALLPKSMWFEWN